MRAETLLREGQLEEAVNLLSEQLRESPQDTKARTFLFELLCFRGDFERARKHLALISQGGANTAAAALLYESAMHAEETRTRMFQEEDHPPPLPAHSTLLAGMLNGRPFNSIADLDTRIGPRLEVFAAGEYLWVPFEHIASLEMQAPSRLRDLLWIPARMRTGPGFGERDLGEILLPALSALTAQHPDQHVQLGRVTEICADERGRERPYGQKTLLVDGEELPLLEVRTLQISQAERAVQ